MKDDEDENPQLIGLKKLKMIDHEGFEEIENNQIYNDNNINNNNNNINTNRLVDIIQDYDPQKIIDEYNEYIERNNRVYEERMAEETNE